MLFDSTVVMPATVRGVYLTLYDCKPWSEVGRDDKERWAAVRDAMFAARDAWRRTHDAGGGGGVGVHVHGRRRHDIRTRSIPIDA